MTDKSFEYDYLIVGQGIAGTLFAFELIQQKKSFMLIDEDKSITSSKIAAGMFTPVSGKRMTITWMAQKLTKQLYHTYTAFENFFNCKVLHHAAIYHVFGSIKEQNDLMLRIADGEMEKYLIPYPQKLSMLNAPFGAFSVNNSGWVNTSVLLNTFNIYLKNNGLLLKEAFSYNELKTLNGRFFYKNIFANNIVFCEGYKAKDNPFFLNLPFVLCKGEVLHIQMPVAYNEIVKKGIYLVHTTNGNYKVGSTYNWSNLNEKTTQEGYKILTDKLKSLMQVPYTQNAHFAGVRPTTFDRKPFVGRHKSIEQMFIFNGLGTKGVMIAPYFAKQLFNLAEYNLPLINDVNPYR